MKKWLVNGTITEVREVVFEVEADTEKEAMRIVAGIFLTDGIDDATVLDHQEDFVINEVEEVKEKIAVVAVV